MYNVDVTYLRAIASEALFGACVTSKKVISKSFHIFSLYISSILVEFSCRRVIGDIVIVETVLC